MGGAIVERRKARRRTSDQMLKMLSHDLSTMLALINKELKEIDKEIFLISETSPFLGRRKEDWDLQIEMTRKLKNIAYTLSTIVKRVPGSSK